MVGNALSKQISIESQWICRNKEFPTPVEVKSFGNQKEITKIWNFPHLQSFVETDHIEKSMDLPKQGIPHTCDLFEDISRVFWAKPRPLEQKRRRYEGFPAKSDISIPLSDWSRDSVAPTHKYCGKLEFRSYAL